MQNNNESISLKDKINTVLIVLIINMQSFYILPIWNSLIIYAVMILILFVNNESLARFLFNKKYIKRSKVVLLGFCFSLAVLILGEVFLYKEIKVGIKLLIFALVSFVISRIEPGVLVRSMKYSYIYCLFYSIYIIYAKDTIYRTWLEVGDDAYTYITVTFAVAFNLTVLLMQIFFVKTKLIRKLILILTGGVYLVALLNYSARANLMFPFVVLFIMFVITTLKDARSMMKNYTWIVILVLIIIFSLSRYQDIDVIARVIRLFESGDSRIQIWSYYIRYLCSDFKWLIGIGICNSEHVLSSVFAKVTYPHNFMLEMWGEFGLVGLVVGVICFTFVPISIIVNTKKNMKFESSTYYGISAAYFFCLLSCLKSSSVYDSYYLFILIALVVFGLNTHNDSFEKLHSIS